MLWKINLPLCILSAFLLIFAYPPYDIFPLAWIALIPLMCLLDGKNALEGFRWGYLCGILFFMGTLFWIVHTYTSAQIPLVLSLLGLCLLVSYLALYFAAFGFIYVVFRNRQIFWRLLLIPSCWVALEFVRDYLFTGFGWVALGHSQYRFLPLIQIADFSGVAGVSFVLVVLNMFLKSVFERLRSKAPLSGMRLECGFVVGMLVFVFCYGVYRMGSIEGSLSTFRIASIQANIPQLVKWYPPAWPKILEKYLAMTEEVVEENPDLVIWPETSFPGYMWRDDASLRQIQEMVRKFETPLLFGAVTMSDDSYYNSAVLMGEEGSVIEKYDKIHLVPFGEFLPFRDYLFGIADILGFTDFTPGKERTVFTHPSLQENNFSVLICFEDTIARVARSFVRKGARLLINITNDAWFLDSPASQLHLQAAVFRSVENRRSLIRVANTGVSCHIDALGSIHHLIQDDKGKMVDVAGTSNQPVAFHSLMSFYTNFGDVFTYFCFGCILWGIVFVRNENKRS